MLSVEEKYANLKKLNYQKSNHDGVSVFYDEKTYLKIGPKKKITLTGGSFYTIMRHPKRLSEENVKIETACELHNETSQPMYCILTDCLFDDEPQEMKIIIKSGVENIDKYE